MKQYDIYKSDGGYRVACETCLGCPVTDSSPWFGTKAKAEAYREKRIKDRCAYIEGEDYPPSMKEREVKALRKLLKKQTYYVLSGEGENGTWEVVETSDIKRLLKKERCGGDRWAKAYLKADCFETKALGVAGYDVETNEQGFIGGAAEEDFRASTATEIAS